MRKLIFLILVAIIVNGFSQSPPKINAFEYYIDTDPGYGKATSVPILASVNESVNFSVNLASVSDGIHMLYLRMKDANFHWSETYCRQIFKMSAVAQLSNITKAEYFIDIDPGYGLAKPLSFSPGTMQSINFAADLSAVTTGIHIIYIRTKDANNHWSQTFSRQFFKVNIPVALSNITKAEYFIDADPGYGKAINISLSPASSQSLDFAADLTSFSKGIHIIYIRTKDANNLWGVTFSRQFYKEDILFPPSKITKAEYFIDTDPGYGKGIPLTVTQGSTQTINFLADLTSVSNGIHIIYICTKDEKNRWGVTFNRQFIKANIDLTPLSKVNLIEYFVDTDPGFGKATQYPIPSGEDSIVLVKEFIATLPVVSETNHTFYIRARDKNGKWSLTYDKIYCQGPSAQFTVDPVCIGETSMLKFNTVNINTNTSFFWDVNNDGSVESNIKGSLNWKYLNAGTYFAKLVVINNQICPNKYKDSAIVKVIVNPVPSLSISPQGNISICPGDFSLLTANSNQLSTNYQWYKNDNPVTGAYNSTFSASAEGNYYVVITNGSSCTATSNITSISFKPQPDAIITPSGVTDLCPGGSVLLNANTGPVLTYQWKLNGNSLNGQTGSQLLAPVSPLPAPYSQLFNVVVTNSDGCSRLSGNLNVNIHAFPIVNLGKDSIITTKHSITLYPGNGYSSYLWSNNATSGNITLQGSVVGLGKFNYSVTVTDLWGCSGSDSINVTVVPPSPTISGFVRYEDNSLRYLDSTKVYLSDTLNALIDSVSTNALGKYIFSKVKNGKYFLSAKTSKKWGGGNPLDALLINRNFIQVYVLPTPLKIMAADVNLDRKINPTDALLVNKRYVKIISSFKAGNWVFESPVIIVDDDDVILNIHGICFGDINGTF